MRANGIAGVVIKVFQVSFHGTVRADSAVSRRSCSTFTLTLEWLKVNQAMEENSPQIDLPGMASVQAPVTDQIGRAIAYTSSRAGFLKKTVDALAMVPTKDRLSLLARKIYNVMMFHAQRQGVDQQIYRARLRDVITALDFNSHNTEPLKEHLRQMVTTKVEWQSPSTAEGARWGVSALIAHAELIQIEGEVVMEWSYSPTIKQAILDPERYAKISLQYQAEFKSIAGLALYEICSRFADNPGGVTSRQPWGWWRPVLTGSPDGAGWGVYEQWKYFNRDVVKPAVAEVSRITDLAVEAIEHKRGRLVADLQFKVSRKASPYKPLMAVPSPVNLADVGRAIKLGVNQDKAERMLEKHGASAFAAAVDVMEARVNRADLGAVQKPEKFLSAIITNHVSEGKSASPDQPRPSTTETKAARVAQLERYRNWKRAEAKNLYDEMTESMRADRVGEFELRYLTNADPALKRSYQSKGFGSPMIKALFLKFLAEDAFGSDWENPSDTALLEFALTEGQARGAKL